MADSYYKYWGQTNSIYNEKLKINIQIVVDSHKTNLPVQIKNNLYTKHTDDIYVKIQQIILIRSVIKTVNKAH